MTYGRWVVLTGGDGGGGSGVCGMGHGRLMKVGVMVCIEGGEGAAG